MIDAGWYECKDQWGDFSSRYEIAKQRYPQGFKGISHALSRQNMNFGLWFMPEGLGHAGDPAVTERMLERVDHMVKNEGMSMYRQDGGIPHAPDEPNRTGINEIRDITSLYALWDEIIRRYPGLVMEGCAGGGRRIDLETIQRFSWIQKSDNWFESNSDQCAIYGGSLFLPGGVLNLPTDKTDDYTAWSSFGGQFCLAWHPPELR